jgi:hypothetical protein
VGRVGIEKTSFELPLSKAECAALFSKEKCAALALFLKGKCTALAIFQKKLYNNGNFSALRGKESLNSI